MSALRRFAGELLGLFVDDRPLATAIALWFALVAVVSRVAGAGQVWVAPAFFAGLSCILLVSVSIATKKGP